MASRTKNEYLQDVRAIMEDSQHFTKLPAGPARTMLKMVHLGLSALESDLANGERERNNVAASKARRARRAVSGQVPIEFPS